MPQRRRLTVLAAVLALVAAGPAVPSAMAQSAGDDQYEDPFAGEEPGGSQQEQAPDTSTPAPAEPAPATPAPPPATTAPAPAAVPATTTQQPELPRTGLDAGPILAIGGVLLGSGIALRIRLRERS